MRQKTAPRNEQDGALGQQLADDAPPARSNGGADGELALTGHALRQQQATDVGAGDEQDQCRSPLQDQEPRAQIPTDARLGEGLHANAPVLVARRFFSELASQLVGAFLRLFERDAVLETRDHPAVADRAVAAAPRRAQRNEVVGRRVGEREARRHDTEDRARRVVAAEVVDAEPLAEDVGIAIEAALPQVVADKHHRLGVAVILRLSEPAPHQRLDAERLDGVIGEHLALEPLGARHLRVSRVGDVALDADVAPRDREERLLARKVQADGGVGQVVLVRPVRRREPELHQSIRIGVGKRPEENGVHQAENHGVGADAQRQRQDDDEGRTWLPGHDTRGKTGVLKELTQKVADSRHGGVPRSTCPSQSAYRRN